jgi:hypothetical protein
LADEVGKAAVIQPLAAMEKGEERNAAEQVAEKDVEIQLLGKMQRLRGAVQVSIPSSSGQYLHLDTPPAYSVFYR